MFGKSALPITLDPTAANDAAPVAPALPPAMAQQPMPAPPVASPAPQDVSAPQAPATGVMPTPASVNPVARGLDALLFRGAFGAAKDTQYARAFNQWHMQQLANYGSSLPKEMQSLFWTNPDAFIATANKNAERYTQNEGQTTTNPITGERSTAAKFVDGQWTAPAAIPGQQTVTTTPGDLTETAGGVLLRPHSGQIIGGVNQNVTWPGGVVSAPPTVTTFPGSAQPPPGFAPAPPAAGGVAPPPGAPTPTAFAAAPPAAGGGAQAQVVTPDIDRMVRTAYAEGHPNPLGWQSVAAVAANRGKASGLSLGDVVAQPGQFEGFNNSRYNAIKPGTAIYNRVLDAIQPVIAGQLDPTNGADSYYSPAAQAKLGRPKPAWDDGTGQMIDGQLFFHGKYGGAPSTGTAQASAPGAPPPQAQAAASVTQNPDGSTTYGGGAPSVIAGVKPGQPLYSIRPGDPTKGEDPNLSYRVNNATQEATPSPRSVTPQDIAARGQSFLKGEVYKDAANVSTALGGVSRAMDNVGPSGAVSMATLDSALKSFNPSVGVKGQTVALQLEHMGVPHELASEYSTFMGQGFLPKDIAAQYFRTAYSYAQSHMGLLRQQHDANVQYAKGAGYDPSLLGETMPSMPTVPKVAQDAVPPPPQRVVDKVYWGPTGPYKWTGKGWLAQ